MRFAALLLGLSFLGCGSQRDPMHGDVSFTDEERSAIERGNVWIAERVGQEPYDIVWDLPHPTDPSSGGGLAIVRGCSRVGYLGWTDPGAHVELSSGLEALAAHELGHTRGLRHLPEDVAGVMNPTPVDLTWTAADQAQCVADRVCKS